MPTFVGKSEKFEPFEDLFRTSLKIHNQVTEEDKINYFHSLMRGDALQTFKNITSPDRENLGEILTVFRRKYVKPQSVATAKHKFQRLVFNPANQKLIDFLDELQKLAKDWLLDILTPLQKFTFFFDLLFHKTIDCYLVFLEK